MTEYLTRETTEQRTAEILKRTRVVVRLEQRITRGERRTTELRLELRTARKFLRELLTDHLAADLVQTEGKELDG